MLIRGRNFMNRKDKQMHEFCCSFCFPGERKNGQWKSYQYEIHLTLPLFIELVLLNLNSMKLRGKERKKERKQEKDKEAERR